MSLSKKIDEDIKNAMRAREPDKLGTLRMLKAAIKNVQIDKAGASHELPDADVIAVIRKMIKQREDSVEGFVKGGRMELADKERAEITLLTSYLPAGLSAAEISALVKEVIAEVGVGAQMGAVMKIATAKAAGRSDGKTLSAEVQKQIKSCG